MSSGYLYVLTNPAIPNLAKVGMTTREPADRIAELSAATGVPSPFILIFQQPVSNPETAERWAHRELDVLGYRHSVRREFFAGPLHEIVRIVSAAAAVDLAESRDSVDGFSDMGFPTGDQLTEDLYQMGLSLEAGGDFRAPDFGGAQRCYEQAALNGHVQAALEVAKCRPFAERLRIYEDLVNRGFLVGLWHAAETHLYSARDRPRAMRLFDDFFNRAADRLANEPKDKAFETQLHEWSVSFGLLVLGYENADGLQVETARKALPILIAAIRARVVSLQRDAIPGAPERHELDRLKTVQDGFSRRLAALSK
jgi:hypothetical protein